MNPPPARPAPPTPEPPAVRRRPRILIVTSGPLCRNPRPLKEAAALGESGCDVTVLRPAAPFRWEEIDRSLTAGAPFRTEVVGAGRRPLARFLRRVEVGLARRAAAIGGSGRRALGSAGLLLRRGENLEWDLAIVHTELPFWIGNRWLGQGRRVAADFEDWHSEDLLPADRRRRPLAVLRRLESSLLRGAVLTTTPSAALGRALAHAYGGTPPVPIFNAFPLQSDPRVHPAAGSGAPAPSLVWFSQTVGPGRGLEPFLAAWAGTRQPSRLTLIGDLPAGEEARLRALLPAGFRPRLEFGPAVAPKFLPALLARHDVGLALERSAPASRNLTITNKLLQYLNAGLAVVASDTDGQREALAPAPEAALLCAAAEGPDVAARLARDLDALLGDRAQLARMGAAARRAAEDIYCWEKQAPRLVAAVESALRAAIPSRRPAA